MTALARVAVKRSISVDGAIDGILDATNKRPCDPLGRFESWHFGRTESERASYVDAYRRAYARDCVALASKETR